MSIMPRPGAWMEKLKQFMSFLMFLTSLWLLWVVASLTSAEYLIGLLFTLIIVTMIIWIKDNFFFKSNYLKFIKLLIMMVLLIIAIFPLSLTSNYQPTEISGPETNNAYGLAYQEFSEELLAKELQAGKAVYIDFTARWCITCQVNKRRVFSSFEVRNFFQKNNVSLLVADWTNKDEKIKISLNKYGRNSVPLNIIYGNKDNSGNFLILPALLSASEVLSKLQQLTLIKSEKN
jgi:thiol:disulfide interchange protein DsbD